MACLLRFRSILFIMVLIFCATPGYAAEKQNRSKTADSATVSPMDMGKAIKKEAEKVKKDLKQGARLYFDRKPLGWDIKTIHHIYGKTLDLPERFPSFIRYILGHGRFSLIIGLLVFMLFAVTWSYRLFAKKHVFKHIDKQLDAWQKWIPPKTRTFFQSGLNIIAAALVPIVLFGLFSLIQAMSDYQAAWFKFTGHLLSLWGAGALIYGLLKKCFSTDLSEILGKSGKKIFRWMRVVLFYTILAFVLFWSAEALQCRKDVLALVKTLVFISTAVLLGLVFLMKNTFLSFLPVLSNRGYQVFVKFFSLYYYPLLAVSFLAAILWSVGYASLGSLVLSKLWLTLFAFLFILFLYHLLYDWLNIRNNKLGVSNENVQFLSQSAKSALKYSTLVASAFVVLNLLGLLHFLQRVMSFPIFHMGDAPVSSWIIFKAILILLAFVFVSRVLQAYMNYKIYPSLRIDQGLGYALNTLLKYALFGIGLLISLNVVGIDLRFLMVFAGAIGIGVGLGIQQIANNFIGGLIIIFGGKIRKGDVIEIDGALGTVTEIFMNATMLRTMNSVEYMIPNSDIISKTLINYSFSSPLIRMELPVGVSYQSDPRTVEKILLDVAAKEPLISKEKEPDVIFTEYADSAINFNLRVWINIRESARPQVRSALYFAIFDEFKNAGIEIPFPQRDLHIKSVS